MKLVALFFLVVVTLSGATSRRLIDLDALTADKAIQDKAFEDEILAMLEKLRELIGTGDPENGIPVLDPFQLDEENVDFQIPDLADIKLSVTDLTVVGLQGFVVNKASINILRRRLDFDITIPSIKATVGTYDLLAEVLDHTFLGKGKGSVEAINLRVHGSAFFSLLGSMTKVNIYVELQDFKSELSGLQEGGGSSGDANQVLGDLVVDLVKTQAALISSTLERIILEIAGGMLGDEA